MAAGRHARNQGASSANKSSNNSAVARDRNRAGRHARIADQNAALDSLYSPSQTRTPRLEDRVRADAPLQPTTPPIRLRRKRRYTKRMKALTAVAAVLILAASATAAYVMRLDSLMSLGTPAQQQAAERQLVEARPGKPYYVLLLASDSREGVVGSDADWAGKAADGNDGETDVMILARIDAANHQLTMLSLPRDTPWYLHSGEPSKIKFAYREGGAAESIEVAKRLTGLPISHVVEVSLSGIMDLVDAVGGIEIDVPIRVDYHEALTNTPVVIEPGLQTLNGMQAEVFARERLAYKDGDTTRQSVVREIVEAIITKLRKTSPLQFPTVLLEAAECVKTDYSAIEGLQALLSLGSNPTIYQGSAPWQGDINSVVGDQWVCYENPPGWDRVLTTVDAGGDPSSITYEGDTVSIFGIPESSFIL